MRLLSQRVLLCVLALTLAAWLRAYTVGLHLPYFYEEDEAHHFNRTVNMVKTGDMNPHYFNKPSLHFYLRMPAIWGGYWWAKSHGRIESIQEVRTHDKYGLADFAFTASHPATVKAARLVSIACGVLIVLLTFAIAFQLTSSAWVAFGAGVLSAVSPDLVRYSGIVGVDIVMSLFCWASVFFGLRYFKAKKNLDLFLCAIAAGLAISSKYNAAPIMAVPFLAAALTSPFSFARLGAAMSAAVVAFFAGSPYILVDTALFIENLSYEIWHYGTAGHEGNMAKPGLEQAAFYLAWLCNHAIGLFAAAAAIIGLMRLVFDPRKEWLLFASFPLLYFLEMTLQKANFIRNMIVIIPFAAVMAAYAGDRLVTIVQRPALKAAAGILFVFALAFEPFAVSFIDRMVLLNNSESRLALQKWFMARTDRGSTAIAGQLMLPYDVRKLPGVTTIDGTSASPAEIFTAGYDRYIATANPDFPPAPFFKREFALPGAVEPQRIVKNPAISVYRFIDTREINKEVITALGECADCSIEFKSIAPGEFACAATGGGEDYCWQRKRIASFNFHNNPAVFSSLRANTANIQMEIMTPWPDQEVYLWFDEKIAATILAGAKPGEWTKVEFTLPTKALESAGGFTLMAAKTESPGEAGLGKDGRRLAFAVRAIRMSPSSARIAQPVAEQE